MTEARVPIGDVLPGISIHELDEGERPVWAFVMVKTEDRDGDTGWSYRTSAPPNRHELLGALEVQVEILKRELANEWE